ncbi:hypothetical protein DKX38_017270 [Salix brachista]|uniref:Protein kinase domain-containing protein n=1 Tax=Salix brachista TaxID=2182728 RepID=A0A5N5KUT1_9ROSI|nr:hypothetical protein DKX38_017270 [Salix brachista]
MSSLSREEQTKQSLGIFWVLEMFFSLKYAFLISVLSLSCLVTERLAAAELPQDEVDALNLISKKMGVNGWNFNADSCGDYLPRVRPTDPERNISCNCRIENSTCHIVSLKLKRFSLAGELPPELIQLPYLESIDLSYNYLNGSIPSEWASLKLKSIALLANRLSGNIPSYLGNFTSLTYLILSSNKLVGNLPMELGELKNLTDFRINDNNFNGSIPDFVENWKQLKRLEMVASGLEGPIPSSISALETLTDLRITDINITDQSFPDLSNITGLSRLLLRDCNLSGEIPSYIWEMSKLRVLDLSFNKLRGELPGAVTTETLVFIFLTGNILTGNIPMFRKGMTVDLSHNNFSQQSPGKPACQQTDVTLNLFRSSSMGNDLGGACMDDLKCDKYWHSLYINCGGQNVEINGSTYEGDAAVSGGSALFYQSADGWGLSSTGDFMDDNDFQNRAYTENVSSLNINEFTGREHQLHIDWKTRQKICVGIAKGLAFLHEESRLKIVHRDIKVTNVLLDKDLNPKISDFGLAKLDERENTFISTRIAGTVGYMAPEYALWGRLTFKADIYSFGIVALEIVSGKHNMSCGPENQFSCLLDWACHVERNGNLTELVDRRLGSEFNEEEALRMIKVALLCTNVSPSVRPIMSEAVSMLEGSRIIPEVIPEPVSEDLRFKAIRGHQEHMRSLGVRGKQNSSSILDRSANSNSCVCTSDDPWETDNESNVRSNPRSRHHESPSEVSTLVLPVTASSSSSVHDVFLWGNAVGIDNRDREGDEEEADVFAGHSFFHQYQVVGRALPTEREDHPKIYRMKLWATNEVRAKSKFWYFLRKLKKVKKSNGQVLAINEIFEKSPTKIKNYGIWLRYQSRTGYHNMYKEYRDTTLNGAVEQMYTEMASRHRVRFPCIQIIKTATIPAKLCKRESTKQFHNSKIKFPLVFKKVRPPSRKLKTTFKASRPNLFIFGEPYSGFSMELLGKWCLQNSRKLVLVVNSNDYRALWLVAGCRPAAF